MANVRLAVNHVVNDKGETVISIGAPGSIERAKIQWPALIENLNRLYSSAYESYGKAIDDAYQMIRDAGVKGRMETDSILMASDYRNESNNGSVFSLTRGIDGLPPMQARNTTMTKKQASNWVKKNCVFAMSQDLVSMVKKAAMEKGVELTDEALVCHAARAVLLAAFPGQAAPVEKLLRETYKELSAQNPNVSVHDLTNAVVDKVLGSTMDKNDPRYFSQRPVQFKQIMPKAQELIKNLDKGELATMYTPQLGKPIGPNAPQPPMAEAPRTRLSRPPMRGTSPIPQVG